jgi:hypothetical protein
LTGFFLVNLIARQRQLADSHYPAVGTIQKSLKNFKPFSFCIVIIKVKQLTMKKILRILMLFSVLSLFAVADSHAQVVVRARLSAPVIVRPVRPSRRHVWVNDEWVVSGGTYVRRPGYWALPPREGGVWVAGHWRHRRGGYVWIPGHWR